MKIVEVYPGILSCITSNRLRIALAVAMTLLLIPATGVANSVTLAWDPSLDSTVTGYRVHYGTTSETYTEMLDTGSNTVGTVEGLVAGETYYFVVTAYNAQDMESLPSWETPYTVPATSSGELRLVRGGNPDTLPLLQYRVTPTQSYRVEASQDLANWTPIYQGVSTSTAPVDLIDSEAGPFPSRYYRLAFD